MKSDDSDNPAFPPHVYTKSDDQSQLLNATQLTTELILGWSALTSRASVPLHFCCGHYPEDSTHKLRGICEQGISFVKSCVPHQNFNLFYLKSHLRLRKTGANQNVQEMVRISAFTIA